MLETSSRLQQNVQSIDCRPADVHVLVTKSKDMLLNTVVLEEIRRERLEKQSLQNEKKRMKRTELAKSTLKKKADNIENMRVQLEEASFNK